MPTKVQASILWENKLDYNGSFQNVQIGAGESLNIDMKSMAKFPVTTWYTCSELQTNPSYEYEYSS